MKLLPGLCTKREVLQPNAVRAGSSDDPDLSDLGCAALWLSDCLAGSTNGAGEGLLGLRGARNLLGIVEEAKACRSRADTNVKSVTALEKMRPRNWNYYYYFIVAVFLIVLMSTNILCLSCFAS